MESMRRQLSTSLPRQRNEADLLSDFKAAALSVTTLYKTAATSQARARAAGFQDALDDLLAFMDKENIGLMDGEGWRIRQWATERLDIDGAAVPRPAPSSGITTSTDDEDGNSTSREEDRFEERGSSPEGQRKPTSIPNPGSDATEHDDARQRRVVSEPPQQPIVPAPERQQSSLQSDFTFRSTQAYPLNHDREGATTGMDLDKANTSTPIFTNVPPTSNPEVVRLLPRPSRNNRHSNHNRRNDSRPPPLNFNLGAGAGNKRKLPYPDFFDISGFNDGTDRKDGNGPGWGGKRGRHA